jgi:hypothetical protein
MLGALYPYFPNINPDGKLVGTDAQEYVKMMEQVDTDFFSAFTVSNGSRPVLLFLTYAFQHSFRLSIIEAVKFIPVLLNPLLTLSVYYMVLHASGDKEWAGLSSLLSSLGHTTTVGMHSYLLANILGLALIFLSIGFLLKAQKTKSHACLIYAVMLGSLAVYSHPWAFTQYYAATTLFLLYTFFREKKIDKSVRIFIYLFFTGIANVIKETLGGREVYSSFTAISNRIAELPNFFSNNILTFRIRFGGLLSNVLILSLSIVGVYLYRLKKPFQLIVVLLLLVSTPYYLMGDMGIQSRILFNIPLSVLAASSLLKITRIANLDRRKKSVIIIFSATFMMVYLLRSLANIL